MDIPKDLARLSDVKQDAIVSEVRADWLAARDARRDREDRAIHDYMLYRRARRDAEAERIARAGFSKIEVPLIYWIVEHEIPRLGVQAPQVTVNALSPEAVPFAQAKQMRMQHQIDTCGWDIPYQMVMKSKLILGDGFSKITWDHGEHRPRFVDVDWFDFFVSAECTRFEAAAVMFHRSFLTKRQIERMRGQRDGDNKPIWHNLDDLTAESTRAQLDDTWDRRAGISNEGPGVLGEHTAAGLVPVIECWYGGGEYVVLGGDDAQVLLRAQMSPFRRKRANGEYKHMRPFVAFRNTLDLTGPYSIGEAEALEHHQVELSTIRNGWIDQMTLNINAPIVYDEGLDASRVEEAFSRPRGQLAVPWGTNGPPIQRMAPGQISGDFPNLYSMLRDEAQITSGMNDNAAGQAVQGDQTATEVQILANEANWRIRLKRRMDEIAMRDVALLFDSHDRQYGGLVAVAVERGWRPEQGAQGFGGVPAPRSIDTALSLMAGAARGVPEEPVMVARIGPEVNRLGAEYAIEIDAGSASRPDQKEEYQKVNALIAFASHPAMAPMTDWAEVFRQGVTTLGFSPEKLMAPPAPPQPVEAPAPPGEAPPEELAA